MKLKADSIGNFGDRLMLDVFALFILILLAALVIMVIIFIGGLPGKIARSRNHPQSDAINICGWVGIFTGGLLWIVALIWAYTKPNSNLEERIQKIEEKLNNKQD